MIDKRDVLRMKVPYPSVNDRLAVSAHMYICQNKECLHYSFVKCQTLKPYMLVRDTIKHYCDEVPDSHRNPFSRATRIDCDKLFSTKSVTYDDRLKTSIRKDICEKLYDDISRELQADGYEDIAIDERILSVLNPLISQIS